MKTVSGLENEIRQGFIPDIAYRPTFPVNYHPNIALIGCGGVTVTHLQAYKDAGWNVTAFCDINLEKAEARRNAFFPKAAVFEDYRELLEDQSIEVVDIAMHTAPRVNVVEAAILAGKHVLSQKPFVMDLEDGKRLVELAEKRKLKLAVNQNGRWAPYVRFAQGVLEKGILGEVESVNVNIHWDQTWCTGTQFEEIHHMVLYDFGIHWFDMVHQFFLGYPCLSAFASVGKVRNQKMRNPMMAGAVLKYEYGLANLTFNAHSIPESREEVQIIGSKGIYRAVGGICDCTEISLITETGGFSPKLDGKWSPDGFAGTMGELLCSIEEDREPSHSARNNLESLAICIAAMSSADSGEMVDLKPVWSQSN